MICTRLLDRINFGTLQETPGFIKPVPFLSCQQIFAFGLIGTPLVLETSSITLKPHILDEMLYPVYFFSRPSLTELLQVQQHQKASLGSSSSTMTRVLFFEGEADLLNFLAFLGVAVPVASLMKETISSYDGSLVHQSSCFGSLRQDLEDLSGHFISLCYLFLSILNRDKESGIASGECKRVYPISLVSQVVPSVVIVETWMWVKSLPHYSSFLSASCFRVSGDMLRIPSLLMRNLSHSRAKALGGKCFPVDYNLPTNDKVSTPIFHLLLDKVISDVYMLGS
ncbi:hypothetical protein Tco_0878860 [Tanacetum coccineum]|uniref:Maturase K n=1 Tax=Tanacetum coccineum TaxID=301880 RepID=A0ABQ5C502_9ASTR